MKKVTTVLIGIIIFGVCSTAFAKLSLENNFAGISGDMLQNAQTRLKLAQQAVNKSAPLTIATIYQLYQEAPKQITKALEPYGYFKPKITSKLNNSGGSWRATYTVNPGPPLKITELHVKVTGPAGSDPQFIKLLQNFALRQGDVFNSANYEQAKKSLFDLANRRGYLTAKMEDSVIKIDRDQYTADIVIIFDSGPRYFFGPITFDKTKFSEDFIRRFLSFKQGEYYSSTKVQQSQQNFYNSNQFKSVTIEPLLKQAKNLYVPMLVHVTPHRKLHVSIGGGYGTDTKLRGTLGLTVNNIGKFGEYFTGTAQGSWIQQTFEASYIIPGKDPITSRYDISAGSNHEDYAYGEAYTYKFGPGYTTIIGGWQQKVRLDFLREKWRFCNNSDECNNAKWTRTTMVLPSISWTKLKANNPVKPTDGYIISLTVQGAPKYIFASPVKFVQGQLHGKWLYPIPRGPILALQGTLGYIAIPTNEKDELPASFWFAAGGAQSIRGYRYQAIGPGTELATASIELRQRIYGDNWYIITFLDMGNSTDDLFSYDDDFLHRLLKHKGAGFGVLWQSPIGSVQLTFARPLDEPHAPALIQFSMGPELS